MAKVGPTTDIIAETLDPRGNRMMVTVDGRHEPEYDVSSHKMGYDERRVRQVVEDFELIHHDLHVRQDQDMADYELDEQGMGEYDEEIVFNEPRHFGDMTVQLLQASVPHIEVNYEDEDHEKENACEQFHTSLMKSADEWLQTQLMGTVKGNLAFWGATRGWMVLRITLFLDKDGNIVPMIIPCDPRFMSWGIGRGRLIWAAYSTWRTGDSIYNDYGLTVHSEDARVTDFWCSKENVVLIDDQEVLREPHNIELPPFLILPVTTTPKVAGSGIGSTRAHIKSWGESIYGANRGLYKAMNKILSIWLSLLVKSDKPGGFLFSDDPGLDMEETPYAKGTVQQLPFTNTRWEQVNPPDIAKSAPELFGQIASAVQRGGFPWVQYGQLWRGQELSGNALEELKEGVDKILIPLLTSMGLMYSRAARMAEQQFDSYGVKWMAQGYDSRGEHFFKTIKPRDLSGNHEITYDFVSIRPQQEAANYAKAKMMKDSQLAPDTFIRKEIVRFQNPQRIEDQMDIQQAGEMNPKVMALRKILKLEKEGTPASMAEAGIMRHDLQMQMMMEQAQMAQLMSPQPPPGQGGAAPAGAAPAGPPSEGEVRRRLTQAAGGGA